MISNSVTHLRSYTKFAITDITRNFVQYHQKLCAGADVCVPSADLSASSADIVASNGECFVMFDNVLRVVHNVSRCITMFYKCFMIFYYVLGCLVSRTMIGIASSVTAQPQIASGIATMLQGSAITLQKSAMTPQGMFGKSTHIQYRRKLRADIAGNSARSPTSPRQATTFPHRATTSQHRSPISSHRMTSARSSTSLPQTQTSPHRAPTSPH